MPEDKSNQPPKGGPGKILYLFTRAFQEWNEDKCPQLGAALAYYTAFSLAPLVLVLLAVFGLMFAPSLLGHFGLGSFHDVRTCRSLGPNATAGCHKALAGTDRAGVTVAVGGAEQQRAPARLALHDPGGAEDLQA